VAAGVSPPGSGLRYRPDIDGLRAIAVLLVFFYHADIARLPGGFLGVDIFFVISGFLITRLILEDQRRGTFSMARFLARRVRRLFPSLALLLVVVLGLGWWRLLPGEFGQVGRNVFAAGLYSSNILLLHDGGRAGYFARGSDSNPLLHLWSLGVEEQFYIVWPICLILLAMGVGRHRRTIVALMIASLLADLVLDARWPSAAFYLPITRAWEFLAGALFALPDSAAERPRERWHGRRWAREVRAILSIVAILVIAAAPIPSGVPRTIVAGVSVVASAELIANGHDLATSRLLAWPPLVGLGLVSYPLYLWHWPFLVFGRLLYGDTPGLHVAVLVLSVAAAVATYLLVERRARPIPARAVLAPLAAAMLVLAVVGRLIDHRVIPSRARDAPLLTASADDWRLYAGSTRLPGFGRLVVYAEGSRTPRRTVAFIGDSHMEHYWARVEVLRDSLRRDGTRLLFITRGGCPPLPSLGRVSRAVSCDDFFREAIAAARRERAQTVAISGFWDKYFAPPGRTPWLPGAERAQVFRMDDRWRRAVVIGDRRGQATLAELRTALADLRADGVDVALIASSPTDPRYDPRVMYARDTLYADLPRGELTQHRSHVAPLARVAVAGGARIVDPFGYLCGAAACLATESSGRPIMRDNEHVNATSARRLRLLDDVIWPIAPSDGPRRPACRGCTVPVRVAGRRSEP
jgi:peptidoglycan/LPS O-acetylase OafA/YrhL